MRRDEITSGVKSLIGGLVSSGLDDFLSSIIDRNAQKDSKAKYTNGVRVMRNIFYLHESLNDAQKQICNDLDLNDVFSEIWWAEILGESETLRRSALLPYHNLNFATRHLPKLLKLLERGHLGTNATESKNRDDSATELELILPEGEMPSKPERITRLIEGVTKVHEVYCILFHEDHSTLAISQMDSGSDKSLTFLGAISALRSLSGLFSDIFLTAIASQERKVQERAKTVAETAKVFVLIKSAEDKGEIGKEEAELCRRGMIEGISALIEVGATTAELAQSTQHFEPRLVMAPEPKLLAAPSKDEGAAESAQPRPTNNNPDIGQFGKLSEEEISQLRSLLDKSQNSEGESDLERNSDDTDKIDDDDAG